MDRRAKAGLSFETPVHPTKPNAAAGGFKWRMMLDSTPQNWRAHMTKSISCVFMYLVLLTGLTMTVVGQQPTDAVDTEIANAPVDRTLAAMNQVPLRIGTSEGRVTQLALMVNQNYPPGQPTVYVADRNLRLTTEFVADDPRRRTEVGLEWTFDARRAQSSTLVNGYEFGHAFGLGHFGRLVENHGGFHLDSWNIMTDVYIAPFRTVRGTSEVTFCGLYGNWH